MNDQGTVFEHCGEDIRGPTLRQNPRATANPGSHVTPTISMRYGSVHSSPAGAAVSTSQYLSQLTVEGEVLM